MSRYKAYPEYAPSETDLADELPVGWRTLRGKYVFSEYSERSEFGEEQLLSVSEYYGVKPRGEVIDEGDFLSRAESLAGYKKCKKNDLVMNIMLAWKCGLGVSKYDGIVSPAYSVFRFNGNASPDYMHYLLRTEAYTSHFKTRSTGVIDSRLRLYPESFGDVSIILPSSSEQVRIVAFLDHETVKIDALIEKQQRLIELLKEKRQAVISHAVTKGLNPKARMRDSGVEWLGEVPAHWLSASLRWFIKIASGDGLSNTVIENECDEDNQYKVIGGNGVLGYSKHINTEGNAFAIGRVGALCGNVHLINYPCWITDNALKLSSWRNFYAGYLEFLLRAARLNEYANRSAQPLITGEQVKALVVTIPPFDEQVAIEKFISAELDSFQALIDRCQSAINLMQERRTALISAAVTGKIDVRDWLPTAA